MNGCCWHRPLLAAVGIVALQTAIPLILPTVAAPNDVVVPFTPAITAQKSVTFGAGRHLILQQQRDDTLPYGAQEAEAATLAFAPGGGFVPGDDGGVAVARCQQIRFSWTPTAAGDYRLWYRARFPFKASWSHTETVADRPMPVNDSAQVGDDQWGAWVWLAGNAWTLGAQPTTFTFDWQGGVELDRVVVAPADWVRERVAALPRPKPEVTGGWAVTTWVNPEFFAGWVDLASDLRPWPGVSCEVAVRAAPDTWRPFDPATPPAGEFRLRLNFAATPGNPVPVAPVPILRYRPQPAGLVAVATPRGRAVFSRLNGTLLLLTGANGQLLYRTTSAATMPFQVDLYKGEGGNRTYAKTLFPAAGVFAGKDGAGIWEFELGDGIRARLTAGPGPADSIALELGLARDAGLPAITVRPQFPILDGFSTGPEVSLFYPMFSGQVVQGLGTAAFASPRSLTYPGDLGSQWITVAQGTTGGVAFGAFDPELRQASYSFNVEKSGAPLAVRRQFARRLPSGETWELTPFLLCPFEGDWRAGAAPYRQWFLDTFPQPPPDPYVDFNQGFLNAAVMDVGLCDYSLMPWQLDVARRHNLRFTLWWAQGADILGACPVQYPASPAMGGADLFKEMNRSLKEDGFTAGYYMNTKLYTRHVVAGGKWMNAQPMADLEPATTRPPLLLTSEEVKALEVQPLDGGGSAYAFWSDMAINEPRWQEYLTAWVEYYWKEYGANHVYLDQFNHSPYAWLKNPADGSVGAYSDGLKTISQSLHRLAGQVPGRHCFTGECFGELTVRLYGQGLWASTRDAKTEPGGYQLGRGAVQGPDYGRFLVPWGLWHEYFEGERAGFNAFLYNLPTPGISEAARQLRREFNLLGSGAWYQDTLGIVRMPDGLRTRTYRGWPALGKFEFITLAVPEPGSPPVGGSLTVKPQTLGKVAAVWLFTPGEARTVAFTAAANGAVAVELPPLKLGYVLLVEELPSRLRLDNLPWEAEPGSTLAIKGIAFRWTAANAETAITLDVNGRRQEVGLPEGPWQTPLPVTLDLKLPAKLDADNLAEFRQLLPHGQAATLGYVSGQPAVRQRMHVSYARQEAVLQVENPTGRRQRYDLDLALPAELGWRTPPPKNLDLSPGERRDIRLPLTGVRQLTDRVWITGSLKCRGLKNWGERPRLIRASAQPPLFDASFEQCVGADGKFGFSTFWHRFHEYLPQDVPLAYQGIYPDTERVHGGRQSLRFDHRRQRKDGAMVMSLFGRAEAGCRYRLSAWFYREHPRDGLSLTCASPGMHGALSVSVADGDPVGQWFRKEVVMAKPAVAEDCVPVPFVRFHTYVQAINRDQTGPVWIDDVAMEVIE